MTRAGLPTATLQRGMSFVTTAPAPMVHPSPMVTPPARGVLRLHRWPRTPAAAAHVPMMMADPPIQQFLPILTGFAYSGPLIPAGARSQRHSHVPEQWEAAACAHLACGLGQEGALVGRSALSSELSRQTCRLHTAAADVPAHRGLHTGRVLRHSQVAGSSQQRAGLRTKQAVISNIDGSAVQEAGVEVDVHVLPERQVVATSAQMSNLLPRPQNSSRPGVPVVTGLQQRGMQLSSHHVCLQSQEQQQLLHSRRAAPLSAGGQGPAFAVGVSQGAQVL